MKRVLCSILILSLFFCGCSIKEEKTPLADSNAYVKGVWFTYSEIDSMLSSNDFKKEFKNAVSNLSKLKITDAFIHIRAFGDSLYKSDYFPLCEKVEKYDFDVFEYMIENCHNAGIRVHAWINPYRIRLANTDTSSLPQSGTVYNWLNDEDIENDNNICISNGIYLNPASAQSRRLVIDGVREAALNYNIDGIHFDDYFYPTTDIEFDKSSYEQYVAENSSPLSLEFWRRANVNALISGCYTAIKFIDKEIIFSISPAASVGKNYSEYYADVSAWVTAGCVDWIIPQIYFGFEYPVKEYCFEELLAIWKNTIASYDTRLIIGLAAYKVGTTQEPDNTEWCKYDDILFRQSEICQNDNTVSGHVFFSYSSLFSNKKANERARKLLQE